MGKKLYENVLSYKYKKEFTAVFSHYYAKIKVDSNVSLSKEKRLTLHNVIILIKSVT